MPVTWHDVDGPPLESVTRGYYDTLDLPAMSKSRRVGSMANLYNQAAGVSPVSQTKPSPASHNRVSPIAPPAGVYEIGQNNLGYPVASAQELPLSHTPAYRYEMPAIGTPVNAPGGGYWQQPVQYAQNPVQYQQFQQSPVQYGYPSGPVQYQQVPGTYHQVPNQQLPPVHELPTDMGATKHAATAQTNEVPSSPQPGSPQPRSSQPGYPNQVV